MPTVYMVEHYSVYDGEEVMLAIFDNEAGANRLVDHLTSGDGSRVLRDMGDWFGVEVCAGDGIAISCIEMAYNVSLSARELIKKEE